MTRQEWLVGLRRQLGLTQKAFAQQLGVSERTLIRWEVGDTWPRGLAYHQLLGVARREKYPPPPSQGG